MSATTSILLALLILLPAFLMWSFLMICKKRPCSNEDGDETD
jgi:hypothetical protein